MWLDQVEQGLAIVERPRPRTDLYDVSLYSSSCLNDVEPEIVNNFISWYQKDFFSCG